MKYIVYYERRNLGHINEAYFTDETDARNFAVMCKRLFDEEIDLVAPVKLCKIVSGDFDAEGFHSGELLGIAI
jgi:hypothetical protein